MVLKRSLLALLALLCAAPALRADQGGVVRLPRAEYDKLKDAADKARETPAKKPVLVPPSVENASYELRVSPDRIALELTADVVVKGDAKDARVVLPPAGLLDSLSDKGPATVGVVADGGRLALVFPKAGRYRIGARFLPAEARAEGQRTVDFTVLPAAAARLAAFGSDTLAVSVSGAPAEPMAAGAARPLPASSLVRAVVRAPARIAAPAEKPLVLADVVDVVRVERDRVTQRVFVRVSVTRAPLAELVLHAAPGAEVAGVSGPSDPSYVAKEDGRIVVTPSAPVAGDAAFSLLLTRPAPAADGLVTLVPTRLDGAASARAFLLLDPNPLRNQDTKKEGTVGVARVDVEDLPAVALPFAGAGTRAYRISGTEPRLALAAPLRSVVAPPDTLLAEADLLTVIGDGGSRVDRRRYVLETRLPHLDLPAPKGEEVLAVAVDGVPATPRVDGETLVVSLPPAGAPRRTVEVVSKSSAPLPKKSGTLALAQQPLPGVASLARWTVVLPEDRRWRVESTDGIGRIAWSKDERATIGRVDVPRQSWGEPEREEVAGGLVGAGNSTLTAHVVDTNGQALPGVTVELRGPARQSRVTDAAGRVLFAGLPAGRYTVTASLSGFTKVEKTATVASGTGLLLPMTMSVSVKEEVVVTGESPVIDTMKSSSGATFPGTQGGSGGGLDLGKLFRKKDKAPQEVPATLPANEEPMRLAAASSIEPVTLSEKTQAGTRSLAMNVTGHGKRLLLSGPLVGAAPFSVTLAVKPE